MNHLDHQPGALVARSSVSTGAGIAIAGAWLGASAVTIVLTLTAFVWSDPPPAGFQLSTWGAIFLVLGIASPMIAAFKITKRIIGEDE